MNVLKILLCSFILLAELSVLLVNSYPTTMIFVFFIAINTIFFVVFYVLRFFVLRLKRVYRVFLINYIFLFVFGVLSNIYFHYNFPSNTYVRCDFSQINLDYNKYEFINFKKYKYGLDQSILMEEKSYFACFIKNDVSSCDNKDGQVFTMKLKDLNLMNEIRIYEDINYGGMQDYKYQFLVGKYKDEYLYFELSDFIKVIDSKESNRSFVRRYCTLAD